MTMAGLPILAMTFAIVNVLPSTFKKDLEKKICAKLIRTFNGAPSQVNIILFRNFILCTHYLNLYPLYS